MKRHDADTNECIQRTTYIFIYILNATVNLRGCCLALTITPVQHLQALDSASQDIIVVCIDVAKIVWPVEEQSWCGKVTVHAV